jgi:hypothetical protein
MRAAGTQLLARAQLEGVARTDIDGTDLFPLAAALTWLGDQPRVRTEPFILHATATGDGGLTGL